MKNGWLSVVISILTALVFGAYGFAYMHVNSSAKMAEDHLNSVQAGVEKRLERMEWKLDRLLGRGAVPDRRTLDGR